MPFRRKKPAAERREQRRRSEARQAVRLLKSLTSIQEHRGGEPSLLGSALLRALSEITLLPSDVHVEDVAMNPSSTCEVEVQSAVSCSDAEVQACTRATDATTQTNRDVAFPPVPEDECQVFPGGVIVAVEPLSAANADFDFDILPNSRGLVEGVDADNDFVVHFVNQVGEMYSVVRASVFRHDMAKFRLVP